MKYAMSYVCCRWKIDIVLQCSENTAAPPPLPWEFCVCQKNFTDLFNPNCGHAWFLNITGYRVQLYSLTSKIGKEIFLIIICPMLCYSNGTDNKDHFENSKQRMHNKSGIVNFLQTQQEITSDWPFWGFFCEIY